MGMSFPIQGEVTSDVVVYSVRSQPILLTGALVIVEEGMLSKFKIATMMVILCLMQLMFEATPRLKEWVQRLSICVMEFGNH